MSLQTAKNWMKSIQTEDRIERVQAFLFEAENHLPAIAHFSSTPQSPPYHAEGPFLRQHIERMLLVQFALEEGETLLDIEEIAVQKKWQAHIEGLEYIFKEMAATMRAYCLLHDIAKPDVYAIDAVEGGKGMQLGFRPRKQLDHDAMRRQEGEIYRKYLQALSVEKELPLGPDLAAAFYDRYELRVHYPRHATIGGSARYREAYQAIGAWLRLREQDRDIVAWMTRHHIEALSAFQSTADSLQYEVLSARAKKAGIDGQEAMDLLLAALLLDACFGSLRYEHGEFSLDFSLLFHFFEAEEQVAQYRLAVRARKGQEKRRRAFKQLLEEHQLIGENVFSLLELPHGPERGALMQCIQSYIQGEVKELPKQYASEELLFRLKNAKATFDAQQRS